jgi:hypothetical protein
MFSLMEDSWYILQQERLLLYRQLITEIENPNYSSFDTILK